MPEASIEFCDHLSTPPVRNAEVIIAGGNVIDLGIVAENDHKLQPALSKGVRSQPSRGDEKPVQAEPVAATAGTRIQAVRSQATIGAPDKGNLAILLCDGKLKKAVTLDVARRFGGVGRRAIQIAIKKKHLETKGERQNRRVSVASLLDYYPPE